MNGVHVAIFVAVVFTGLSWVALTAVLKDRAARRWLRDQAEQAAAVSEAVEALARYGQPNRDVRVPRRDHRR